jgi:hypothetical protein
MTYNKLICINYISQLAVNKPKDKIRIIHKTTTGNINPQRLKRINPQP